MNEFEQCRPEGATDLLALLIKSGRVAEAIMDSALASVGLSFAKWRTLDILAKTDAPMPLKSLSEKLDCVKSNITQLVDKLESGGFLARERDPDDRRGTLAAITHSGELAHRAGREALERATMELFNAFDSDARSSLVHLLNKIMRE